MSNPINSFWDFDPSKAPRSFTKFVEREVKGSAKLVSTVHNLYILAALPGCTKVSKTRWLPDEGRWEGMTKGQEPVAWMLYPEYPELK